MNQRTPWHYFLALCAVALLLAPAVLVASVLHSQDARIDELNRTKERQGDTLVANGLPREGRPGRDGASVTGPAGRDGQDGVSIRGPAGPPGRDGKDGVGVDGTDGEDGTDGTNGTDGEDGQTVVGPAGPPGASIKGDQGEPGPQGPQGEKGDTGEPAPPPVGIWVPDGMGGYCQAADPDGDGVYACPEVTLP